MIRDTLTSDVGEYVLSRVDPGLYTLRFELPGFAPFVVQDLEVLVGETQTFSPEIVVAAEEIVITAEARRIAVARDKTQQSNHIDSASIEDLPINRRDYLDLALLTPGVVDSNYVADDRDFRIAPTPASGLGIGGGAGRGNTFTIDGLNNNYSTGSVRSSISQDAVQEFQVNRNSFSAELGGAPGGAINIVTKGGTNDFRGSVFGVLRNRRFQARNHFDPAQSAYTRAQSGGAFGGPILRGTTFFYTAYERLDRHESSFVPLLRDKSFLYELTPSQQALADGIASDSAPPAFAPLAPLVGYLAEALVPGNYPHVVRLFESNSGVFPFSEERQQFITRVDHAIGSAHKLFLRGNWTGLNSQNTSFGSLIARDRGRNNDLNDFSLAVGNASVISPEWISETWLGIGYHDFGVYPTDPHGPSIDINGFGYFGRDLILPTRNVERTGQARQNFTYVSGRHSVKFGADYNPLYDRARSETFFSGKFVFGEAIPLSVLIDQGAGYTVAPLLKDLFNSVGRPQMAAAVDAPISSLQAYALGLPLVYQQGFGDPFYSGWAHTYGFFVEDSWRVHQNFLLTLGLRYELFRKADFPRDNNNFGPRMGFAWSPDAKTVIRGGYGIFHARIDGHVTFINDLLGENVHQIIQVFIPLNGIPGVNSALTGEPLNSAEIYHTLLNRGVLGQRQITAEDLALHGFVPTPGLPFHVRFQIADDMVNPYSQQASLEIQREAGGFALSAGYNFNRGVHIVRPLDVNPYQAGTNALGRPIIGFHNPNILQDNIYGSWSNSFYHALILQLEKRFSEGFLISAHHTWSKAMDEITDYNTSFQPHLQWDAASEMALSSYHRGHRFVVRSMAQLPWKAGRGKGFFRQPARGSHDLRYCRRTLVRPVQSQYGLRQHRGPPQRHPPALGRGPQRGDRTQLLQRRPAPEAPDLRLGGPERGCRGRRIQPAQSHQFQARQRHRRHAHPGRATVLVQGSPGAGDGAVLLHVGVRAEAVSILSPRQFLAGQGRRFSCRRTPNGGIGNAQSGENRRTIPAACDSPRLAPSALTWEHGRLHEGARSVERIPPGRTAGDDPGSADAGQELGGNLCRLA